MKKMKAVFVVAGFLFASMSAIYASTADTTASGDYINIGKVGVGPSWDSLLVPLGAETGESAQIGTLDGRYWVNNKFGFDAGFGFGLNQASPQSQTVISLRAEGMVALKETKHNVFYADAELVPIFWSGTGSSQSFLALQGGLGLEHAMSEISNLSVYTEWEPVSFGMFSPGGGASNDTSLGFLGSVMNFTMGLRYYF